MCPTTSKGHIAVRMGHMSRKHAAYARDLKTRTQTNKQKNTFKITFKNKPIDTYSLYTALFVKLMAHNERFFKGGWAKDRGGRKIG